MTFSRERHAAFEQIIESTATLLSDPNVLAALGSEAERYRSTNAHAFLPNFRAGVARLPLRQRKAGNVAIIPVLGETKPGETSLAVHRALAERGPRFQRQPQHQLRPRSQVMHLDFASSGPHRTVAQTFHADWAQNAQPFIVVNMNAIVPRHSKEQPLPLPADFYIGRTLIHEYDHGHMYQDGKTSVAEHELHAYNVQHTVKQAFAGDIETGDYSDTLATEVAKVYAEYADRDRSYIRYGATLALEKLGVIEPVSSYCL